MAQVKPNKSKEAGRVKVELPRGSKHDAFVAVNGVSYIIPKKGVHDVPPEIAEELYRSQRAEDAREDNSAAMRSAAN
jgi:hypothetical protein